MSQYIFHLNPFRLIPQDPPTTTTTTNPINPTTTFRQRTKLSSQPLSKTSSSSHHSHSHHHHHHNHLPHNQRPSRPRSVSRSSSSPSPPPSSSTAAHREKRRSFTTQGRGPAGGTTFRGRGRGREEVSGSGSGSGGAGTGSGAGRAGGGLGSSVGRGGMSLSGGGMRGKDDGGFMSYAASASSPGYGASEADEGGNYFVGYRGDDTEVEERSGNGAQGESSNQARISPPQAPSSSTARHQPSRRPLPITHHPLPASRHLLPFRIGLPPFGARYQTSYKGKERASDLGFQVTRKNCESGLVIFGVGLGVFRLGYQWEEWALAGEISLLIGLSLLYLLLRRPRTPPISKSTSPQYQSFQQSIHNRERSARLSSIHGSSEPISREDSGSRPRPGLTSRNSGSGDEAGERGCIWGTEERDYRECMDDGALFALLLGPMVAASLLHSSLLHLSSNPTTSPPKGWRIESPLVLSSTPIRILPHTSDIQQPVTDAIKALSALSTSRRNLVQLFTLLSFVLLVQLVYSRRHELKLQKVGAGVYSSTGSFSLEKEGSHSGPGLTVPLTSTGVAAASAGMGMNSSPVGGQGGGSGNYWLRRGEWKRSASVVGFAFVVTLGCLVVKAVTAYIGRGVWSDMSPSDIVIATLFYQFSLYVCVRLARRGFTLGELGLVCHGATALFMETVNMTRMKILILRTPYIKTYRLPTPLLTFQLALIPGSLLTGFLLSPLLVLSRHLAQKPAYRLRFPHEKPVHRRLLALGFYAGALAVCGGIVGFWTKWCLGWRDPWVWVFFFLGDGSRGWTRVALLGWWAGLACVSVAGWGRQLARARRHRRYVVASTGTPNSNTNSNHNNISSSGHAHAHQSTTQHPSSGSQSISSTMSRSGNLSNGASSVGSGASAHTEGLSGVATQMMDAADLRMPTLSVNARRKFFHALAVVMFVPGVAIDPAFTHLSLSLAFAAFVFVEYIRYFALWPFGASVHLFLNEFLDHKDSGTAILSHFYLLAGCACPLWLEGGREILWYFGILALGIGDALASIVGRRLGRVKWSSASGKTFEGSLAFLASMLVSAGLLWAFGVVGDFNIGPYFIASLTSTLLEGFSAQNDNLILPIYGWAVGVLLGV